MGTRDIVRRVAVALVLVACAAGGRVSWADPAPARPAAAASPNAELADLATLFRRGAYDAVIAKATTELKRSVGERKDLLYLRGCAYYEIAWFGAAEGDLAPLQEYRLGRGWTRAWTFVKKIGEFRRLAPPHVHEVKSGSQVLFRVYYDSEDTWTRALIDLLPEARAWALNYWGASGVVSETPVFVFATRARFEAFLAARSTDHPASDMICGTVRGGMLIFCERHASGDQYIISGATVLHEYSHLVHRRLLGNAPIPVWLEEGTAQVCEALAAPSNVAENELESLGIAADQGWLPLDDLTDYDRFHAERNEKTAYIQAFAMTRYLIDQAGKAKVTQLLNLLAEEQNVGRAFRKALGMSQEEFYEKWLNAPT